MIYLDNLPSVEVLCKFIELASDDAGTCWELLGTVGLWWEQGGNPLITFRIRSPLLFLNQFAPIASSLARFNSAIADVLPPASGCARRAFAR